MLPLPCTPTDEFKQNSDLSYSILGLIMSVNQKSPIIYVLFYHTIRRTLLANFLRDFRESVKILFFQKTLCVKKAEKGEDPFRSVPFQSLLLRAFRFKNNYFLLKSSFFLHSV